MSTEQREQWFRGQLGGIRMITGTLTKKELIKRLNEKPKEFSGGSEALRYSHYIHRKQRNRIKRRLKRENRSRK